MIHTASVLERLVPSDKNKTKQNPSKVEVLPWEVGLLIIPGHFGALESGAVQREKGKEIYGSILHLKRSSDTIVFPRAGHQV